jgi:hypothetical protein
MLEQDGAVEQQQLSPEALKALLQQAQQQQEQVGFSLGGVAPLLQVLTPTERLACQAELQVVLNQWLRKKGLIA